MSAEETSISLTDLQNLIALDTRSVMSVGGGNSAAISIPCVDDLDIDPEENLQATVSVREKNGEIIVTARISVESEE